MTVRELLSTTDARELSEWQAYHHLEYFEKRIKEKSITDYDRGAQMKALLFGKADAKAKQDV